MELSSTAKDILDRLPEGTLVCCDEEDLLVLRVPRQSAITNTMLDGVMHCTVQLRSGTLTVRCEPNKLPSSPRQHTIEASTVSEKHAADMVAHMGCIDLDYLVPDCSLSTTNNVTTLYLSKLFEVDHDSLQSSLSAHATGFCYNLKTQQIEVTFPAVQKRKAR